MKVNAGGTGALALRARCDELAELIEPAPSNGVALPEVTPLAVDEAYIVAAGDALSATLSGINRATAALATGGVAFAGEPIEMQLSGELVGLDAESGDVFVRITTQGRGKRHG